jgi:hypothetical protein
MGGFRPGPIILGPKAKNIKLFSFLFFSFLLKKIDHLQESFV